MSEDIQGISKRKVGRYGGQIVFDSLPGAKWANGNFETSKTYDIEWEGIQVDVFSSSVLKRTGFIFSNSARFKEDLVNVFVGIDNETTYFWVKKGINKTGFYAKLTEAITLEQLPDEIRKVGKGGE